MKRGILETVAAIVCFSGLIAYQNNPYWLTPMVALVFIFLGFNQ